MKYLIPLSVLIFLSCFRSPQANPLPDPIRVIILLDVSNNHSGTQMHNQVSEMIVQGNLERRYILTGINIGQPGHHFHFFSLNSEVLDELYSLQRAEIEVETAENHRHTITIQYSDTVE